MVAKGPFGRQRRAARHHRRWSPSSSFSKLKTSLFLSAGNIVNLFNQAVVFIMFAIGEVFVLLLGEIDLSMVYVAGIGAG